MSTLAVLASGMVTAVGFNAPATLAAMRAGISGVRELPYTALGVPLRGAKVALPQWWEGIGKLAELVAPAIHECLLAAAPEAPQAIPILLGVADRERPGRLEGLEETLLDEIQLRLELPQHAESKLFPASQTGCAHALVEAHRILASGRARYCIVAGVDSFLHAPTLDAYDAQRRLVKPGNSNGFFPGEAGSAVLLSVSGTQRRDALKIIGFGRADEPAPITSTQPMRAQGLTLAVKQALSSANLKLDDVHYRLTDLSGEHYKFKEALFVLTRLDRGQRETALDLWHPIEYLGEIGAAILPCLLAWALHAQQQAYAPGPLALCHVGNDAGQRAALVVRREYTGA